MIRFIKEIFLIVIILLIIGLYVERYYFYFHYEDKEVIKPEPIIKDDTLEIKNTSKKYVDIKGEVASPGVYEINEGFIINDVISLAGGLTETADLSKINLSKKVSDEDVIYIYSKEEVIKEDIKINYNNTSTVIKDDNNLININTADKNELMKLNGIGEVKASSIIEYRNTNGLFLNIEDIKNVPGISSNLYEKIKAFITI
ncbi:MAG: competence protein ComEA [Mollicutes bacterium]|nr:competence protein ComEA [Mollicutes bacterium]